MKDLLRPALFSLALLLPLAGCDKATPVAPDGTTLAISADPSTVSLNGTSTITVIGRRPNGSPLVAGTEIQFSTNLGRIDPLIGTTDSSGVVTAVFQADNRAGTATVTASTGTSTSAPSPTPSPTPTTGPSSVSLPATSGVSVSTSVQVGATDSTRPTLILNVNPSNVPVNSPATVTVIARNSDGTPVAAGQQIILTTTLGTLSPERPTTESDGTATSTLNAGSQSGTATITAILGASQPATTTLTIRDAAADIVLQPTNVNLSSSGGTLTFTAFVTNTQSQPFQGAVVTFNSIGTFSSGSNVGFTDSSGSVSKMITYSQEQLTGVTSFTVTASTPGPTGSLISASATVHVLQ
jgi:Invasin, domain 3